MEDEGGLECELSELPLPSLRLLSPNLMLLKLTLWIIQVDANNHNHPPCKLLPPLPNPLPVNRIVLHTVPSLVCDSHLHIHWMEHFCGTEEARQLCTFHEPTPPNKTHQVFISRWREGEFQAEANRKERS
jgi:hypothetical protein